jgi:hypothetical protein
VLGIRKQVQQKSPATAQVVQMGERSGPGEPVDSFHPECPIDTNQSTEPPDSVKILV